MLMSHSFAPHAPNVTNRGQNETSTSILAPMLNSPIILSILNRQKPYDSKPLVCVQPSYINLVEAQIKLKDKKLAT